MRVERVEFVFRTPEAIDARLKSVGLNPIAFKRAIRDKLLWEGTSQSERIEGFDVDAYRLSLFAGPGKTAQTLYEVVDGVAIVRSIVVTNDA